MGDIYKFQAYHDPWMDNGLELLYTLIKNIEKQFPQVVKAYLDPYRLVLEIQDRERFVNILESLLERHIKGHLFYFSERSGEKRLVIKPFVGFNQQPPRQRPPLYQPEKMGSFLQAIFSPPSQRRREEISCSLCGLVIPDTVEKLTLSVYPFVTKTRALSGVRTRWNEGGLRGITEHSPVCLRCYFIGSLTWADSALLYRCDIGGPNGNAIICLPFPPALNLVSLHRQKEEYRPSLETGVRSSNVRVPIKDWEEAPPGQYTLLLAFLEKLMADIIARRESEDLFGEVRRRIPDGWLILSIPQGKMKNITVQELILEEEVVRLLKDFIEEGVLPYREVLGELWMTDEEGRPLKDRELIESVREDLAAAVLFNDFDKFALPFIPKPRRRLAFSWGEEGVEGRLEKIIKTWRWKMNQEELEVVKKAGRALARIAADRKQPAMLYGLERACSSSDLLEILKEASHRLIGMDPGSMQYISLDALEQLTEKVHEASGDARKLTDLKNTLAIFAGIQYAKETLRGGES